MNIRLYQESDREAWDTFVSEHLAGTIYHTTNWIKSIEKTFNQKQSSYIGIEADKIKAILPLFYLKTFLAGKKAISLPWAMYGGILANSDNAQKELLYFAEEEIKKRGIDFLELRHLNDAHLGLPKQEIYVTYRKELEQNDAAILQSIPRKSRASVRNAYKKYDLKASFSRDVNTLYNLYLLNKRKLGSPPYPRRFFETLINEFKNNAGVLFVEYEDKIITGVLYFIYKDTIYPYFSGANEKYNFTNSNNLMYYELMKYALKIGLRKFDFGRSRINTGAGKFKENMGFEPIPLHYYYYSPSQLEIPNVTPSNRKFDLVSKIWTNLPISLTEYIGPKIVKRIP